MSHSVGSENSQTRSENTIKSPPAMEKRSSTCDHLLSDSVASSSTGVCLSRSNAACRSSMAWPWCRPTVRQRPQMSCRSWTQYMLRGCLGCSWQDWGLGSLVLWY